MTDQAAPSSDIWAPYLKEGEEVLWQGRPSGAFHMRRGDGWNIFGGIIAMLITGLMAIMAFGPDSAMANGPILFKVIFGGIVLFGFLVGLYMASFQFYFAAVRRGKTRYAITNQRALSLTTGRKEKFEEEALNAATNLDYVPGNLASIYYKKIAKRVTKMQNKNNKRAGHQRQRTSYSTKYIYKGFELIPDGAVAYQTMLGVIGAKLANPDAAKADKGGEAWQDFLFEGEELLWQGAPGTGPRPTKAGVILTVIGVAFIYLFGPMALYALLYGAENAHEIVTGAFGTFMFLLGLWMAFGIWVLDIRKRKATRYALTNKRAFVAKAFGGRNMLTYAIKPHYRPLLLEGRTDEVTFGEEDAFDHRTGEKIKRAISFQYLKDGQKVYDILTRVSMDIDAAAEAQK